MKIRTFLKRLFSNKFLYVLALILFIFVKLSNGTIYNLGYDLRNFPSFIFVEIIGYILISAIIVTIIYLFKSKK